MPDSTSNSKFLNVMAVMSVALAATVTWRVFFPPRVGGGGETQQAVVVPGWEKYAVGRHQFGPADAPITIIEFADFECPACRQFNLEVLGPLRKKHPSEIRWVFRHWPLEYHRFAAPAARAAECAADQGRFEPFHDAVYQWQDSLGLITWNRFAAEAKIVDTVAFTRCNSLPGPNAIAEADARVAVELKGKGTPMVIVNGLRFPGVPSQAELGRVVDSILAKGK
jgi:protein-disulfide isomerase